MSGDFINRPSNASQACSTVLCQSCPSKEPPLFLFLTSFLSQLLTVFPFLWKTLFLYPLPFPAAYLVVLLKLFSVSVGLHLPLASSSRTVSSSSFVASFFLRQEENIYFCCFVLLNVWEKIFPVESDLSPLPRQSFEEMHAIPQLISIVDLGTMEYALGNSSW